MQKIHIFTALVAVSFILIVGIVVRYTGAADVTTTAEIQNAAPTVDTIRVATTAYGADDLTSGGILPSVGADRTIHVNGQISDTNGEADIASSTIALVFFRTSQTNTCTADKNDCYRITTCDTNYTDGDDTQISYNCEVSLAYWVDATDAASTYLGDTWTSYVVASDIAAAQATLSATIEVNSLLALNLPDAIDYSTRTLSEQSSSTTNVETILTQRGNTKADVQVSGTSMSCSLLGTLPISSQAWALTDVGFTSSTVLTNTATSTARNINLRTDDVTELSANLYWNIAIPSSGVKGTCTGANTIAIIAAGSEEGNIVDGRIQNLRYVTENRTGFTGTTGNFVIEPNETTSFYVGNVLLGSIAYDDIQGDRLVFLQDLLGLQRTNITDTTLINTARFIQSLAVETNITGTTVLEIPQTAHDELTTSINFTTANDSALQTELDKVYTGRTLRTVSEAEGHLNDTLAVEGVTAEYTVTASQGSNTTITPASRTVSAGNTTTFTVSADAGYALSVSGCSGTLSGNTYTTGTITANCTVTTSAVSGTFTVTPTEGSNVSMSPNTAQSVSNSSTTSFTITASAGYTLNTIGGTCPAGSWSGSTYTTGAITTNCTVTTSATLNDIQNFAAATNHTLAVKSNGTLWAWGNAAEYKLGLSDLSLTTKTSPTQVGSATNWLSVAAGVYHSLGLRTDGTLWSWGYSGNGQGGQGDTTQRTTPTQIGSATDWSKVVASANSTFALKTNGTLWAWGYNSTAQLGQGNTTSLSTPTQIGSATNWSNVGAGAGFTFAIKTDGTLYSWGANASGQLGQGNTLSTYSTPTQIGSGTNWSKVAAGSAHTLAIKTDGTLYAWGANTVGQLGLGDNGNRNTPTQVGSATNWSKVAAGSDYSLAVTTGGTLYAWGLNSNSQLGLGDTANRNTPTQVGSDTNWIKTIGGVTYSFGMRADGTLYGWGLNSNGQLGLGNTTNKTTPTVVPSFVLAIIPQRERRTRSV